MVFEVRDLWPDLPIAVGALKNPLIRYFAKSFERWAYRNSEHVVALSPGMKDGVARTGFPADKVSVIPNSCDVDLFRVSAERGEEFLRRNPHLAGDKLVTYTGTFGIINGVEYLADVAAVMRTLDPDVRFLITGDGMRKEHIIERARSLEVLNNNLWVIPPVPKSQVPDLLAASTVACSLFVNLSEMWHNSANKFFDALAAGRPIMINYGGWQKDLLERTGAGLVVPPDNPQEAARLLCSYINDKGKLLQARSAAKSLADEEFSRDKLFEKLHNVLMETARKGVVR
jgi:glycosyltransferase involved in cell wall biosynthesis